MGLNSRNLDRSRRRALKRLCRGDIGAGHLLIPVPDPEQLDKEAKLARAQLQEEEAEHFEATQADFLPFDDPNSSSRESDNSVTFFLGN